MFKSNLKTKIVFLAVIFCGLFGLAKNSLAATINASSCSYSDVQLAINSAQNGDTVTIPSGTCIWTTELNFNKGISLIGAGIDSTVLVNNVPASQGTSGQMLIEITSTDPWRLSGMTITDTGTNYDYKGNLDINAISNGWKLDHVKFVDSNYRHMFISRMAPGVIHDCIFENSGNQAMNIRTSSPTHAEADALWQTETHIGGSDAIFIEDCIFNNTVSPKTAFDSEWGAKVVFRSNTLINSYWLNHGCENGRSAIWIEAYGNNITMTMPYSSPIQTRRGGTGVAFNNEVFFDGGSHTWQEYVLNDYCSKGDTNCCMYNREGVFCTEYPCLDQVGRTYDQILEPLYSWNNIVGGSQKSNYIHTSGDTIGEPFGCADAIQKNRDYYEGIGGIQVNSTSPFNGTEGVGWGTIANRPTACSQGVAYWAIDEGDWNSKGEDGVLYKCTAENTWTKHYEPFPYPHTLREEQQSDTTAPAAPGGFKRAVGCSKIQLL